MRKWHIQWPEKHMVALKQAKMSEGCGKKITLPLLCIWRILQEEVTLSQRMLPIPESLEHKVHSER